MSARKLTADEAQRLEVAEEQLRLIASLEQCPGYQKLILPRLRAVRKTLADKVADGQCQTFEDYKATVALGQLLDVEVLNTLTHDKKRHQHTYAELTGMPHPVH